MPSTAAHPAVLNAVIYLLFRLQSIRQPSQKNDDVNGTVMMDPSTCPRFFFSIYLFTIVFFLLLVESPINQISLLLLSC